LKRIAIVTTHPIQYQAHWFRAMATHPGIDLDVFFCHRATPQQQADAGFGVAFDWDIPLLDGYPYRWLNNVARDPSLNRFGGLDTPEIRDIIRNSRYDAVINCGWHRKSYWQSILACLRTGTPVMVRSDSHLHTERSALKSAVKFAGYNAFIPRMNACLAVGKWAREYFRHFGARDDRIFLVPHTIDEKRFGAEVAHLAPCRQQLRADWKLPQDSVVFLWVAKFISKKRPLDFLRALRLASAKNSGVHGLMVGDGPLRAESEIWASDHHAPVTFAGFLNQSEIIKAYVAADVLVLPSDGGETWGLVVNEAMACGLPCIVSDKVGCGPDLVDRQTGAVFRLGDTEQLASLMSDFAVDRSVLRKRGEAASQKLKEYSTEVAVNGVLQAVAAVMENRR